MTKRTEFIASIGAGLMGIAAWAVLVNYLATKLAAPILV
jgi:hypothetical protein